MKKNIFLLALLGSTFTLQAFAAETVTLYGGMSAITYQMIPNQKPRPIFGEGDCKNGQLNCPITIYLSDVASPPPTPTPGMPTLEATQVNDEIGTKSFSLVTNSGQTFTASVRMRSKLGSVSVWMTCTSPNQQASSAISVLSGSLSGFKYAEVQCPRYALDSSHYINAVLQLTIEAGKDFGYLR